jgi:ABC-type lipoprotein release transport system permease subunit
MILKLTWRNLWRNRRRSLITMASVTFTVILAIVMQSIQLGTFARLVQNVVRMHTGYVQVHASGYWTERIIDNSFEIDSTRLRHLRSIPGIRGMVPRLESYALITSGERTRGCQLIGTDLAAEDALSGIAGRLTDGIWMPNLEDQVYLTAGLAKRLSKRTGDTIILLGQGYHGAMAAGKFRIAGIIRLTAPQLNDVLIYTSTATAGRFLSAEQRLTTLAIDLKDADDMDDVRPRMTAALGQGFEVMNWKEMMPEIDHHIRSDSVSFYIWTGILYLIIALGIFSTLLMMMAERRYELGMLLAIGMQRTRISAMLLAETLMLTVTGTLIGMGLSLPLVWWLREHPIRIGGQGGKAFMQWGFEPIIPTLLDPGIFMRQGMIVLSLAVVIGLFPVLKTQYIQPVRDMKK